LLIYTNNKNIGKKLEPLHVNNQGILVALGDIPFEGAAVGKLEAGVRLEK
jgi:hypothetical protein